MNQQEQFQQFRHLTLDHVASVKQFRPDIEGKDWVCRCSESLNEFLIQFPTDKARQELLDLMFQSAEEISEAVESVANDLFGPDQSE